MPENPLKAVNAYLIRGKERHLIVDTGMNRVECREAMETDLRVLNVDFRRTDNFIDPEIWGQFKNIDVTNGFPPSELGAAIEKYQGRRYQALGPIDFTTLGKADIIRVGDYTVTPIMTPGLTCGHFCLYEKQRKILFSGDHLLEAITPCISVLYEANNPLGQYVASLTKSPALRSIRFSRAPGQYHALRRADRRDEVSHQDTIRGGSFGPGSSKTTECLRGRIYDDLENRSYELE